MNQDYQTIKDKLNKQNKQIVEKFHQYTNGDEKEDEEVFVDDIRDESLQVYQQNDKSSIEMYVDIHPIANPL